MNTEIGTYDAKTKLAEILRKVVDGESFTITNRGKPIADLVPSKISAKSKTETAIKNILRVRKHHISDDELKEMKQDGRR